MGQSPRLRWTFAPLKPAKMLDFRLKRLAASSRKRLAVSIESTEKNRGIQMEFANEKELQDHCVRILRSKGIDVKEEVWCGGLRADVVIGRAVIEFKKTLTRDNIFQAVGQGKIYQSRLKKEELWIVGQMPKDLDSFKSALHTARELAKEGIRVSFVDRDVYWQEGTYQAFMPQLPRISFSWLEQYRVAIAVVFIILSLLVWDAKTRSARESIHNAPYTTIQL